MTIDRQAVSIKYSCFISFC